MDGVRQTVVINARADEAFDFTINPDNTPTWVDGVVKEETSENPTKLGTIYRNQDHDGNWAEFEITAFDENRMFELKKRDDNHHVRYTFRPLSDEQCELEYFVWSDTGEISERFAEENIKAILQKLKLTIEKS